MDVSNLFETILTEHKFWLQIMGDHARFIFLSLTPNEVEYLQRSQDFIIAYDELLDGANKATNSEELEYISDKAYQLTLNMREFKLLLLSLALSSEIKIHLTPTFINDMLNELEEYLTIMSLMQKKESIYFHPLHYHLLWLTDAVGHAAYITSSLDMVEKDIIDKSSFFESQFVDLLLKATIMNGYIRTQINSFPALDRLNKQAENAMAIFKDFLTEIRDQRINGQVLGTLFPLMADHMVREGCYYIWKLSQTAGLTKRPDCNPTSPRIEG